MIRFSVEELPLQYKGLGVYSDRSMKSCTVICLSPTLATIWFGLFSAKENARMSKINILI